MSAIKQPLKIKSIQLDAFEKQKSLNLRRVPFSSVPYFTEPPTLTIYQNSISLSNNFSKQSKSIIPERKKNDINNFSKNSRLRCIQLLSKVKFTDYGKPIFLTTTFHNIYPKQQKELKKLLDNFIKSSLRIKYKFHYIWRLELQKRGAPHFHFILLPLFQLDKNQVVSMQKHIKSKWLSFLKDNSLFTNLYSCKFIETKNIKNVSSYLSKYVSKTDSTKKQIKLGRIWGYSRNININPISKKNISFHTFAEVKKIILKYLSGKIKISDQFRLNLTNLKSLNILIDVKEFRDLIRQSLVDRQTFNDLKFINNL